MTSRADDYRLTRTDDLTTGVPERYLTMTGKKGPSGDAINSDQITKAIQRIHEDTSCYPHYPWASLAEIAGPMCPEDLIIATARTGHGKSLFLQNLFHDLIFAGRFGLYIGLEQSAEILRTKWACLASDVPPTLILAPKPGEQGSPFWTRSMALVQEHFKWQKSPDIRTRAHFSAQRKISAKGLIQQTEWGLNHGAEFIIVDHVDRIAHGDGKNSFHEMSETIRTAKELAVQHRIIMILASQVGRPGDPLEQFMPPALHNMRGGGTKEEEADTVLGIYRPIRQGVTAKELKEVREGTASKETIIKANTMGVMILKHRLDGAASGKRTELGVKHQRVFELRDIDRHTTVYGGV